MVHWQKSLGVHICTKKPVGVKHCEESQFVFSKRCGLFGAFTWFSGKTGLNGMLPSKRSKSAQKRTRGMVEEFGSHLAWKKKKRYTRMNFTRFFFYETFVWNWAVPFEYSTENLIFVMTKEAQRKPLATSKTYHRSRCEQIEESVDPCKVWNINDITYWNYGNMHL